MDMCQTTLKLSLTLTVLNNEKLPMFVHASRTELRATLPNGVLNTVFAVGVFAMNWTSLFVTTLAGFAGSGSGRFIGLAGSGLRGSAFVPTRPLLTPLKLISVVGVIAALPHRLPLMS